MVKLQIISDLHMDHEDFEVTVAEDADYLLVAGDIGGHTYLDKILEVQDRYKKIYLVMGNHDYWNRHKTFKQMVTKFENKTKDTNIMLLQGDAHDNGDFVMIGGTLWTDHLNGDPVFMNKVRNVFADYRYTNFSKIKGQRPTKYRPEDALKIHQETKEAFDKYVKTYSDRVKVVMTHHMPTDALTSPQYMSNPHNGVFSCTDMASVFSKVDAWVYGHTHDTGDTVIAGCRMVCNPRGYPWENPGFNPVKTIEIDEKNN